VVIANNNEKHCPPSGATRVDIRASLSSAPAKPEAAPDGGTNEGVARAPCGQKEHLVK